MRAPYDEAALNEALQRLVQRHPVLRTSFDLTNYSEPLQLVQKSVTMSLAVEDISPLSAAEQEAVLAQWQEAEKQRYFDWRRTPLLRFHIHRRSAETFQFSFANHHAILDGWSVAAMLTELCGSYLELLNSAAEAEPQPTSCSVTLWHWNRQHCGHRNVSSTGTKSRVVAVCCLPRIKSAGRRDPGDTSAGAANNE